MGVVAGFCLLIALAGIYWLWILGLVGWGLIAAACAILLLWLYSTVRLSASIKPAARKYAHTDSQELAPDEGPAELCPRPPAEPCPVDAQTMLSGPLTHIPGIDRAEIEAEERHAGDEAVECKVSEHETGDLAATEDAVAADAVVAEAVVVDAVAVDAEAEDAVAFDFRDDVAAPDESSEEVAFVGISSEPQEAPVTEEVAAHDASSSVPVTAGTASEIETPAPERAAVEALPECPAEQAVPVMPIRRAPAFPSVSTGLDIGSYEMKIVQVAHSPEGPVITGFASARTPAHAISDGRVRDPGSVARALRVLARGVQVPPKAVVACASGKDLFLRVLPLPRMKPEELSRILSSHGEQFIPIPREEASYAFSILDSTEHPDQMEVLLAATNKELPDAIERSLRGAQLSLASLDVDALASFRGLRMAGHFDEVEPDALIVLVDFGASATRIGLFWHNVPRLVRSVPLGGQAMTMIIADMLKVSRERAEQFKRTDGLEPGSPAQAALQPAIPRLLGELRQSVEWFLARNKTARSCAFYLLGGGAALRGLPYVVQASAAGYLDERLSGIAISVVAGGPGPKIAIDERVAARASLLGPEYVTALGLALRG
jgi:type IV pilus assembly protein PilM